MRMTTRFENPAAGWLTSNKLSAIVELKNLFGTPAAGHNVQATFSEIIEATPEQAEAAADAIARALCPDEHHPGYCEVPWTLLGGWGWAENASRQAAMCWAVLSTSVPSISSNNTVRRITNQA